ncbi:MAG TPA: hypothetical protein VNY74_01505 [Edaphobacter sp.]|nr:hypothetical protein [Edaphobacter sp.]
MGDLDRAKVDIFLSVREGDSAGSKSDDAKNDEEYADDGGSLHGGRSLSAQQVSATCDVMPIVQMLDVPATVFLLALVDNSNRE